MTLNTRIWIVLLAALLLGGCSYLGKNQTAPQADRPLPDNGPAQVSPAQSRPHNEARDIRGVIEGFYGDPWTTAQRIRMLSFLGEHHFNTYVYAPKDDPYQRKRWSDLYPSENLRDMQTLVQTATTGGIHFVYSLSPGLPAPLPGETSKPDDEARSITYSSPADRDKLAAKIDQLRSIGVHDFLLSFDDVQEKLKPADQSAFGNNYASAHVALADDLYQREHAVDPNFKLWYAPTTYYGVQDNPYWQEIRTRLDTSISVIWTGKWVLNETITSAEADEVATLLGRKPLLWDNYPVNDYTYVVKKAPQLFLGPLEGRSPDLPDHLSGYIANPQLQEEASKVALATAGDYLQNPAGYQPNTAWKNALPSVGGVGDPTAWQHFAGYAEESTLRTTGNPEFTRLTLDYWNAPNAEARASAEARLRAEFESLAALPEHLHATLDNQALLTEIDPWLQKLAAEAQAGLAALDHLHDPQNSVLRQQLKARLQAARSTSYKIGDELLTFAQQAAAR
ncbi:protein O-GlcNAcase [Tumebacillus flagellatus]|uniref:GH84 domain-containing protein n=1 Tax=Tumebacillus flagellatus TaxID=1157490 RepID=A0A074LWB0_9BACL|nr:protein O-GlcNAcase [Tumebacillus flagellatus]KEO84880.1 hypothetical protein EL26_02395 [Tumebacillus flagellatus]